MGRNIEYYIGFTKAPEDITSFLASAGFELQRQIEEDDTDSMRYTNKNQVCVEYTPPAVLRKSELRNLARSFACKRSITAVVCATSPDEKNNAEALDIATKLSEKYSGLLKKL